MTDSITTLTPAALKPGASVRLLPPGLFRANDGRPEGLSAWRIDSKIAQQLIVAATARREAYVIDYEHQSLHKEKNGQPAPAAGWFKGVEWREGEGLFMTGLTWTPRAHALILGNEYRYLSPVFSYDHRTGAVTGLVSAALTNTPALESLVDLAAATARTVHPAPRLPAFNSDTLQTLQAMGLDPVAAASAIQSTSGLDLTEEDRQYMIDALGVDPLKD